MADLRARDRRAPVSDASGIAGSGTRISAPSCGSSGSSASTGKPGWVDVPKASRSMSGVSGSSSTGGGVPSPPRSRPKRRASIERHMLAAARETKVPAGGAGLLRRGVVLVAVGGSGLELRGRRCGVLAGVRLRRWRPRRGRRLSDRRRRPAAPGDDLGRLTPHRRLAGGTSVDSLPGGGGSSGDTPTCDGAGREVLRCRRPSSRAPDRPARRCT